MVDFRIGLTNANQLDSLVIESQKRACILTQKYNLLTYGRDIVGEILYSVIEKRSLQIDTAP